MSWTQIFPVLDDDHVREFLEEAPEEERRDSFFHVEVEETFNPQPAKREIASFSLFWKYDHVDDPEIGELTREKLMQASELGLVRRGNPWSDYVQPLLDDVEMLARARPEVCARVHLANDMKFLVEDFVERGAQVCLMKSSSVRHSPGAMWRFLPIGEPERLITVCEADRYTRTSCDLDRTRAMDESGFDCWRVPAWGDVFEGKVCYSPMMGGQLGVRGGLMDVTILAAAFIWHRRRGTISGHADMPGCGSLPLKGAKWAEYGFDELFLKLAVFPRMIRYKMLSFIGTSARSTLLPVDIEYVTWGNRESEMVHFPTGLCCGADEDFEAISRVHKWVEKLRRTSAEAGKGRSNSVTVKPPKPRMIALCTTCKNRRGHLEQTLPQTLETLAGAPMGVAVVLDFDCHEGTAEWLEKEYHVRIAQGHLVVARVRAQPFFNMGLAKAIVHSIGCEYAKHLFNLDADNFLSPNQFAALLETAIENNSYVGHQYVLNGDAGSCGRVMLPSWLYRRTDGYHTGLSFYGGDDQAMILDALREPSVAFVPIPLHGESALMHGDEQRLGLRAGHVGDMNVSDHSRECTVELVKNRSRRLEPIQVEIWDGNGHRTVTVKHGGIEWLNCESLQPLQSTDGQRVGESGNGVGSLRMSKNDAAQS